jgi:hypothetical protein
MMNDRWMMQMYDTDCNAIIEEQELIAGLAEAGKFFYPHHTCSASATEFWTVFFDNLALVCTQLFKIPIWLYQAGQSRMLLLYFIALMRTAMATSP